MCDVVGALVARPGQVAEPGCSAKSLGRVVAPRTGVAYKESVPVVRLVCAWICGGARLYDARLGDVSE